MPHWPAVRSGDVTTESFDERAARNWHAVDCHVGGEARLMRQHQNQNDEHCAGRKKHPASPRADFRR